MSDTVMIAGEAWTLDQMKVFRDMWQAMLDAGMSVQDILDEAIDRKAAEEVARYLALLPESRMADVEIEGKKYRGRVFLVEDKP